MIALTVTVRFIIKFIQPLKLKAMNPTVKVFFSTIGGLFVALLRFIVATLLAIVKLLSAIILFLINVFEETLNRLKPC